MAQSLLQKFFEKYWYSQPGPLWALYPLELFFQGASWCKQKLSEPGPDSLPVPVLVVGNITLGGTGKTPTLISLVKYLQTRGLNPGVVSRGYGREDKNRVFLNESTTSAQAGDEPRLIYELSSCPVCVYHDRAQAATYLLERAPECNVILADDGLQHYKLKRDFELALVDGNRVFGNGHLLPLGPLRERPKRLHSVDWLVVNVSSGEHSSSREALKKSFRAKIRVGMLENLNSNKNRALLDLAREWNAEPIKKSVRENTLVYAVAGIANPSGFFKHLGVHLKNLKTRAFADHHNWSLEDLKAYSGKILLTTSKDAVKIKEVLKENPKLDSGCWWQLHVEMELPEPLLESVYQAIINWKKET